MQIQIFSVLAAISGTEEGMVWSGDVSDMALAHQHYKAIDTDSLKLFRKLDDDTTLNVIYRFFNRVEIGDHERLLEINYRQPSLSVGDFVSFKRADDEGFTVYRVASHGFQKISGNADVINELIIRN